MGKCCASSSKCSKPVHENGVPKITTRNKLLKDKKMRNSTKKIDNNLNIDVASDTSSMIGVSPKISPRTAGFEIVTNIYKEIIECENEIELLRE